MQLEWSTELNSVIDESRDVAVQLGHPLTTAHLLLCLFMVENRASFFLSDHQVTADRLMERLAHAPREDEHTWDSVMKRAHETALVSTSPHVTSLHVLLALCSFVDSAAYRLISALDLDMGTVRSRVLAHLTAPFDVVDAGDDPTADDMVAVPGPPARTQVLPAAQRSAVPRVTVAERDEAAEDDEPPRRPAGLREPADVRRRRRSTRKPPARPDATRDLAKRLFDSGPRRPLVEPSDLPLPPSVRRSNSKRPSTQAPATEPPPARSETPEIDREQLLLSESEFPLLHAMGRNLTLEAYDGAIDAVVGRDPEIERLIDILNKRRANNPVLVGDAGVGKTAVVEGLARRLAGCDGTVPSGLAGRVLVELEASTMISGTGVRGSFSERIRNLKAEVARAAGRVIVFLDELHHWIGAGTGDGAADGAGELKTALARGEFPCIGATTFDEYSRFVEPDPAFARRFQRVRVEEPTPNEAMTILTGVQSTYEAHHGITFDVDAIDAAVRLTHRYLPDRRLPDKAIGVLDLAGSRARRTGVEAVGRTEVATVVAELAGLSADKLVLADHERFNNLAERLAEHVVGHHDVVGRVSQALRRNYAGFISGRPIGTFLFLGPTGVGKTEFAKAIARVLFDNEESMVRLDMSEFMEPHTVARLVGAPPGYVGHDAGGQLTESVRRRPYQLVLFDEVEKAHPDVLNLLIQLLDEGRLTDSRGRTVDFANTVVVMTSNLGADEVIAAPKARRVGFGASDAPADDAPGERALEAARGFFRPELWNRIQERLVFLPLGRADIRDIAELQLRSSSRRLSDERRIRYEWTPAVIDLLIESGGYDPELGARPMRATIERVVEGTLASLILSGEARAGSIVTLDVEDGEIRASVA